MGKASPPTACYPHSFNLYRIKMRHPTSRSYHLQAKEIHTPMLQIFIFSFLFCLHHTECVFFNFNTSFEQNMQNVTYEGDAIAASGVIQLTKNQLDASLTGSAGRASYSEPIPLWDPRTKKLTDFTTHFSFIIKPANSSLPGDGLSFFLAPSDSSMPNNSSGGYLALVNRGAWNDTSKNHFVAVEFDTFQNDWDPSSDHVGINVNSIVSVANVSWNSSMKNGSKTANAWITYNSTKKNLSVFLTYADNPIFDGNSSLWYIIDLSTFLPDAVRIGFSAATGINVEIHNILTWSFNSTLEFGSKSKTKIWLIAGTVVGVSIFTCILGFFLFILRRNRSPKSHEGVNLDVVDDFEKGTGPKRFSYIELRRATNNFAEAGKLGEGGFGGVYRGMLTNPNTEVAVKRVSRSSKQGRKEYASEVRIISRLRHRNLVQLIGWCHEKGELLLVYEFMPNGSLDSHLFGSKDALPWPVRHKIALGLASALLYLHEEWEQCVVHRDIKSSNIMLDSNFNAKLGDFGLARLVDHELGSQTTVLAGTMGYLAPECVTTGKASKESDVFSFGVVALEIACGRKPVLPNEEPGKVGLVEWVWGLYGKGLLMEAIDQTLSGQFDEQEIERLMVVGLWCCHPDYSLRPTIKQAINVLNFEAPLPSLPSKFPVPIYVSPPMMSIFTSTYAASSTNSDTEYSHASSGVGYTTTNSSLQSGSSSTAPLLPIKATA
ncbi:hypothetical protein Ancab_003610 [Ancistrocladus abbreviatus]